MKRPKMLLPLAVLAAVVTILLAGVIPAQATIDPAGPAPAAGPADPPGERFARIDRDGDGELSADELGDAAVERLDRTGDGRVTQEDFEGRDRGERLARFFQTRFLRHADVDRDRDVETTELAAFLDGLDADADGILSPEELASIGPRRGQGERLGPPPGSGRGRRSGPGFEPGGGALAQALDEDEDGLIERLDVEALFAKADADGDGVLAGAELAGPRGRHGGRPFDRRPGLGPGGPGGPGSPGGGRGFAGRALARGADGDRDRTVTPEEWTAFLDGLPADAAGVIAEEDLAAALRGDREPPRSSGGERPEGVLTRLFDRDDDGALEIADLESVYQSLDANGDGALEGSEIFRRPPRRGPR